MRGAITAILLVAIAASGFAVEIKPDITYENTYLLLAVGGGIHSIGGDFDGESFFMTSYYEVFIVPEIESSPCWSVTAGIRHDWLALEASFATSSHDMTWAGAAVDGGQWTLSGNGRAYLPVSGPVELYTLLGGTLVGVQVEDGYGYYDEWSGDTRIADASYSGLGLNLGAGITYHITQYVALQGGVLYHPTTFFAALSDAAVEETVYDIEGLNEASLDFTAEVVFYMGPF